MLIGTKSLLVGTISVASLVHASDEACGKVSACALDEAAEVFSSSMVQMTTHALDDARRHQGPATPSQPPSATCVPGFDPPFETNCPMAAWIDAMVRADPKPGKVIMDVGCNKGNDALSWMERWDMSKERVWSARKWTDRLKQKGADNFVCKAEVPKSTAMDVYSSTNSTLTEGKLPVGVCVEPMSANLKLLRETSADLGYTNNSQGTFVILEAAVTDRAAPGQTIMFPDGAVGQEDLKMPPLALAQVPLRTVDDIVHELGLSSVDILTIDTEGADPNVLKGAVKTLASVRYLEFEVHRDLEGTAWHDTTLKSVVDDLDQTHFDCYWQGNNGKLVSMQDCWRDSYETGTWANAACVKRNDVWADVLKTFTVPYAKKDPALS